MVSLDERITIGQARVVGQNVSFRKFYELDNILVFMKDFEKQFNMPSGHMFGSVAGIMHQFMCFDLPVKQRDKDEVVIYFMEDDPKNPIQPKIEVNMLWLDKKSRKVLSGPPNWFNEKKQKEIIGKWN